MPPLSIPERIIIFDSSVRISTHDPAALYFKDLKLGRIFLVRRKWRTLQTGKMDDLAISSYTSGTTGDSKGVMLTYSQYYAALKANNECVCLLPKRIESLISFHSPISLSVDGHISVE